MQHHRQSEIKVHDVPEKADISAAGTSSLCTAENTHFYMNFRGRKAPLKHLTSHCLSLILKHQHGRRQSEMTDFD